MGRAATTVIDLRIERVDTDRILLNWTYHSLDTLGQPLLLPSSWLHARRSPNEPPSLDNLLLVLPPEMPGAMLEMEDSLAFYTVVSHAVERPDWVTIPSGSFIMGQAGVATPEHEVTLTRSFLLSRTEITGQQYVDALNWANDQGRIAVSGPFATQYGMILVTLAGSHDQYEIRYDAGHDEFYLQGGSYSSGSWGPGFAYPGGYDPADRPAIYITWYGAACYCDWLSEMEGRTPYYNGQWQQIPVPNDPYAATGYRLPTEAEWEYTAQFDDERVHPWGDAPPACDLTNFDYCIGWTSLAGTRPSGAGALGLLDLGGNAMEWCNDRHGGYSAAPQTDPAGPATGIYRVERGGCWTTNASTMPCAWRHYVPPGVSSVGNGFRVCRTLP